MTIARSLFLGAVLTALLAPGCRSASPAEPVEPPRVLLLGDSISIGYTPFVKECLEGRAFVTRASKPDGATENCQGTTHGVQHVDRWLAQEGGDWDVIHFNFGLHDLKRVIAETGKNSNSPSDPRQAELPVYEAQLEAIVERLETSGAALVFATTTPVPAGVRPHRDAHDVTLYNAAARRIMHAHGIAIDDLCALVGPRIDEFQNPHDVHFNAEGSRFLGEAVAQAVLDVLARNPARP
jgi:lysophospholipase L1-like esterase